MMLPCSSLAIRFARVLSIVWLTAELGRPHLSACAFSPKATARARLYLMGIVPFATRVLISRCKTSCADAVPSFAEQGAEKAVACEPFECEFETSLTDVAPTTRRAKHL